LQKIAQIRRERTTEKPTHTEHLALKAFDQNFFEKGIKHLAGVDEAGRGALAGPVVAAAVVLPPSAVLVGVDDSKKLKEADRENLFTAIVSQASSVGIGIMDPSFIDKNNILVATLNAMHAAVENLKVEPDLVIVDGCHVIQAPCRVAAIIGGDGKSLSIAAASIVAKVTRDRLMRKLHKKYPRYNFLKNKGYGTSEHIQAICRFGMISEHRKSYRVKSIEKNPRML
jgi:ribonuclease HII